MVMEAREKDLHLASNLPVCSCQRSLFCTEWVSTVITSLCTYCMSEPLIIWFMYVAL